MYATSSAHASNLTNSKIALCFCFSKQQPRIRFYCVVAACASWSKWGSEEKNAKRKIKRINSNRFYCASQSNGCGCAALFRWRRQHWCAPLPYHYLAAVIFDSEIFIGEWQPKAMPAETKRRDRMKKIINDEIAKSNIVSKKNLVVVLTALPKLSRHFLNVTISSTSPDRTFFE